jgi:YHS domain-containing protein
MKVKLFLFLFIATIYLPSQAQSGTDNLNLKHFNLSKGVALSGYDPVSYFNNKPVKGTAKISVTYKSIIYYFSTPANKETFLQTPDKFLPQYGGWCAFAMGDSGEKVEVDPGTYKIINGKLYLFYNAYFNNTLTSWNKNEKNLKLKADANWIKTFK